MMLINKQVRSQFRPQAIPKGRPQVRQINKIATLFLILLSFDVRADETFYLKSDNYINNKANNIDKVDNVVKTVISSKQLTRISFDHPVESINSLKNELEYDIQGKDVFLRTNTKESVNFFVKTDNGNVYKFIARVSDIPATQVFVRSDLNACKAEPQDTKIGYLNNTQDLQADTAAHISKIIDIAQNPRPYLGYSYTKPDKFLFPVNQYLSKRLVAKVEGNGLIAEKITITGKSDLIQDLDIKEFITKDTIAISHTGTQLLPGKSITLIKVTTNLKRDTWA